VIEGTAELVALAGQLGRERFAPRAAAYDVEAAFPVEDYADLADAGLLALCVPKEHGGLGADFETYCLVAAELGRHCGATALTFNMHSVSCLWSHQIVDDLALDPTERDAHDRRRTELYRMVVEDRAVFAQPFSEPEPPGGHGAPMWSTAAEPVEGGFVLRGTKHFASLSGHADHYSVTASATDGAQPADLFLVVDAGADGLEITGDWDPLGMRATSSRTLVFHDVFVPEHRQLMPRGAFRQAALRWPHMFFTLTPTYIGIARAAYDFCVAYLGGGVAGGPTEGRRSSPVKQLAVAHIRLLLDQAEQLWRTVIAEAGPDPDREARLRMFSAQWTVMEHANEISRRAIETCGGRSIMRSLPLERLYRDSRCGALMLPYSNEVCLERLGRESLYQPGERD
jgi:alkylation response protein AidB-like acyl-CoA dehydrogenase